MLRPMKLCWLAVALLCSACKPYRNAGSCDGPCPSSKINHLAVVVMENHTFDNYFGRYCTAAVGSAPTCNDGPNCCEAGPDHDPSGASPINLDDTANGTRDPNHTQACEVAEMNGGAMDRFVTGASGCSDPGNFAYVDPMVAQPYWGRVAGGALADRYFQPIAGASSSNDMYLARAQYVFTDNLIAPDVVGKECSVISRTMNYTDQTIYDLLDARGVSWAWYIEGLQAMQDARAKGACPEPPALCAIGLAIEPCVLEVADVPAEYYPSLHADPKHFRDLSLYAHDVDNDTVPQVVLLKPLGFRSEHPGQMTTLSLGVEFAAEAADAILATDYGPDGLVLVTWDEGGGFFDHVAPPPASSVDHQPYGTRVPLIAQGPFARVNWISHVTMEHSSIVKFIEWNWLGGQTGQLGGRDAVVANIGSLLDPAKTGTAVPE
jgi:phospholipase C